MVFTSITRHPKTWPKGNDVKRVFSKNTWNCCAKRYYWVATIYHIWLLFFLDGPEERSNRFNSLCWIIKHCVNHFVSHWCKRYKTSNRRSYLCRTCPNSPNIRFHVLGDIAAATGQSQRKTMVCCQGIMATFFQQSWKAKMAPLKTRLVFQQPMLTSITMGGRVMSNGYWMCTLPIGSTWNVRISTIRRIIPEPICYQASG